MDGAALGRLASALRRRVEPNIKILTRSRLMFPPKLLKQTSRYNRQMTNLPDTTIFVYGGKGGVGKSTVCTNLAYSLHLEGYDTALFDADFEGPSIPTMIASIEEEPVSMDGVAIQPGTYGGVEVASMGLITDNEQGVYWSGKYLEGALEQLLYQPDWDSEILVMDLPPGSGEIHRNVFSNVEGKTVAVTTPQNLSYSNTNRGFDMLNRLETDVLGVVENMSHYECGHCHETETIFEGDSADRLSDALDVPILAELPVEPELGKLTNRGEPYVLQQPHSDLTKQFRRTANRIVSAYEGARTRRPKA